MGGATPGQVVLGCKRKQAEQALMSKPVSIPLMVSASVPASAFISGLCFRVWKTNKPFPPQIAFGHSVYHSNRNQGKKEHMCLV